MSFTVETFTKDDVKFKRNRNDELDEVRTENQRVVKVNHDIAGLLANKNRIEETLLNRN